MKKMVKKICVCLAVLVLSACAVSKEDIAQERQLVSALRDANQSDRDVVRSEQAVKVAAAALATANASLVVAKQKQEQAHAAFESLYQAAQPAESVQP